MELYFSIGKVSYYTNIDYNEPEQWTTLYDGFVLYWVLHAHLKEYKQKELNTMFLTCDILLKNHLQPP